MIKSFQNLRNFKAQAVLAAALLLLSGCMLGPNFSRPAAPDAGSYSTELKIPADGAKQTAALVTAASETGAAQTIITGKEVAGLWWGLFQSPALNALITEALNHNPSLQAAEAALTVAREQVDIMEGSLFPAITATGSARRQKISGAQYGNPGGGGALFNVYNASVNVSYTLDVFGAIRRQIESLQAEADYQRFQLEAAFSTLAANIVTTVIQEAALRAQIVATEDIIDLESKQLDLINKQFELGGISKREVLTQRAALQNQQAGLPQLQKQLQQNQHLLTALIGTYPSTQLASFSFETLKLPTQLPLSLPANLVAQRPDVRANEALLHAAGAQIGVATANLFPNLTLSANMGSVATRLGDIFMPGSGIWSTGLNIMQPIFQGAVLIHQRRATIASYEQAAAQYRSTVLTALQNVADVLTALEEDAQQLQIRDRALATATENLQLNTRQHQLGGLSYLFLLDAQLQYSQAKIAQVKAKALRFADTAALFQALGGGWWQRADLSRQLHNSRPKLDIPVLTNPFSKTKANYD